MSIALPGTQNLFSQIQDALTNKLKGSVALNKKCVHHALDNFGWTINDISSRPTCISELVPLLASVKGHHDMSELGAGVVWFHAEHLVPRERFKNKAPGWHLE